MQKNETLIASIGVTVNHQFTRFVVVGAIAAASNIGSRIFFSQFFNFETAVVLAFPVGLTVGFLLSRHFVFSASKGLLRSQAMRFISINLLALAQVWIISVGLANFLFPFIGFTWRSEFVAHTIGVLSPVVTSYLGHKHFTFKEMADENA